MKNIIFLLFIMALSSCSASKNATGTSNNPIDSFIRKIEKTTLKHNKKGMIKLLDKEFYQMQYFEIHEENIVSLSNEYFCGEYQGKYKCIVFDDIVSIKTIKVEPPLEGEANYTITFQVTNKQNETIQTTNTWIKRTTVNNETSFGFFGPAG